MRGIALVGKLLLNPERSHWVAQFTAATSRHFCTLRLSSCRSSIRVPLLQALRIVIRTSFRAPRARPAALDAGGGAGDVVSGVRCDRSGRRRLGAALRRLGGLERGCCPLLLAQASLGSGSLASHVSGSVLDAHFQGRRPNIAGLGGQLIHELCSHAANTRGQHTSISVPSCFRVVGHSRTSPPSSSNCASNIEIVDVSLQFHAHACLRYFHFVTLRLGVACERLSLKV